MTDHLKCSFQTQTPGRTVWQLTPAAKQKLGKMKFKLEARRGAGGGSYPVWSSTKGKPQGDTNHLRFVFLTHTHMSARQNYRQWT